MTIPQTKRLSLQELTPQDAPQLYLLNLDPEVIRYTGDAPFGGVEEARAFLERYDHYQKHGFGRWAVVRRADGEFLGWCGLKYTEALDEVDIGFRFFRKHWGQGYATEAAEACLHLGHHRFHVPQIVGRAMAQNTASIRVLEKIGLKYAGPFDFDGMPGVIYNWQ